MVAHRLRQPDLRLPHPFRAALAPPMQKQNDRPLLVVVPPPLLGQIDLEAVGHPVQLDPAIQKASLLRGLLRACVASADLALATPPARPQGQPATQIASPS